MSEPIDIPNKSSFKINEVCALTGVKSYVLRFWESEFTEIAPLMSSSGLKIYEHKDIEAILLIKKLLFEDKLSIDKAKLEVKHLLPREELVESSFRDFVDEDYRQGSTFSVPSSSPVKTLYQEDKLSFAKKKLNEIISLAEVIQQKHNW